MILAFVDEDFLSDNLAPVVISVNASGLSVLNKSTRLHLHKYFVILIWLSVILEWAYPFPFFLSEP